jgi:dTDP-4-amino-4,6-dideoxygalactose transaminase
MVKKSKVTIPFLNLQSIHFKLEAEMLSAFQRVYNNNWFILGDELKSFEQLYSVKNKVNYCLGTSNGLDALILSMLGINLLPGDEVILPSNTYIATAIAASHLGCKPVFVEPRLDTYNINPSLIEEKITSCTKAIVPVHLYGQACEMDIILEISKKYNLKVIEDNAQSHFSMFGGRFTGTWGDVNATSFYPGKNLGALGDAGAITTNDYEIYQKILALRNYGSYKKYENEYIGYNMRLDELQAAFLKIKLNHIESWIDERIQIASYYQKILSSVEQIILPYTHEKAIHTFHLFVIRTKKRNDLQEFLHENGIGTLIHYPIPPHLQKSYSYLGHKKGDFPIAEEIASTCLSLPLWPGMTNNQIEYVCERIIYFFKKK